MYSKRNHYNRVLDNNPCFSSPCSCSKRQGIFWYPYTLYPVSPGDSIREVWSAIGTYTTKQDKCQKKNRKKRKDRGKEACLEKQGGVVSVWWHKIPFWSTLSLESTLWHPYISFKWIFPTVFYIQYVLVQVSSKLKSQSLHQQKPLSPTGNTAPEMPCQ